jgi:heme/copper-type cytochrome/quinol oxidase subunit 2
MATLIAWWWALQSAAGHDGSGQVWGPFFWFWLAVMAVLIVFWVARFASRRGPPPLEPRQ